MTGIAVLGLGLIGGSILRRLTEIGLPASGYDNDESTRAAAAEAGLTVEPALSAAVAGREIVLLAVPLPAMPEIIQAIEVVSPAAILTDVASVKSPTVEMMGDRRYVAGHPMFGVEGSGFGRSDAGLIDGAAWALCLQPETALADWLRVARIVLGLGARVVPTTAADHDRAVAAVSHLPHVLAAALTVVAGRDPLHRTLAAGSFRDGTRVAATRPELTTAMYTGNAPAVGESIAAVLDEIAALRADPYSYFRLAHELRATWPDTTTTPAEITLDAGDPVERLLRLGAAGGWIERINGAVALGRMPEPAA